MHKGLLHTAHENVSEEELEGQVDWRTEGAVSDVKDQGEIHFYKKYAIFCWIRPNSIEVLISFGLNSVENSPSWLNFDWIYNVCLIFLFRRKYILRKTWYFDRVSDKYFSVYFFVGTRLRFEPNWDFHPSEGRSDFSFRVAFDVSHRGVNLQRTSAAMNQCSLLFALNQLNSWLKLNIFVSKFFRISVIFTGRTKYFWSTTYYIRSQSSPIRPIFLYEIKRRFSWWLHP